jgi:hypothetical protein
VKSSFGCFFNEIRTLLLLVTLETAESDGAIAEESVNIIGTFRSVRTRIRIAIVDIRFAVDSRVPRQAMASVIASAGPLTDCLVETRRREAQVVHHLAGQTRVASFAFTFK